MAPVHAILNTHTPLRLRRTLLGIACQTEPPASVTLSCDSDDPAIGACAEECCREFGLSLTLITRRHTGASRPAQTRNNAVRHLLSAGAEPGALLLFLDGDTVPEPGAAAKHRQIASDAAARLPGGFITIAWRYDLTPEQDASFDEAALRAGGAPVAPTPRQVEALRRREARCRRQALLRRLGLAKQHKPKVLGAHFALPLGVYLRINGHDETFEGYAQEDDDLGRRVYLSGGRPVLALTRIAAFHQHHQSRQPGRWSDCPNAKRLLVPCEVRCARGVENPLEQPPVAVARIGSGPTGR